VHFCLFHHLAQSCSLSARRETQGRSNNQTGLGAHALFLAKELMTKLISLRNDEPHPRDFDARLQRSRAGTLAGRKHSGRRALILLAAIAVPAIAAPEEWRSFDIGNAGHAEVAIEPMPFEQAGDSFPGSAFYYLAPDTAPPLANEAHSDTSTVEPFAGPVARALKVDNSGIDRSRAMQCLTAAVYYEAASEADAGQRAVAQVVLNRVAHPSYPNTVCGVVFQGSERRTGCQFSFTCDGAMARVPDRQFWMRAEKIARAALSGYVERSVGLATHYHTIQVHPYWADSLVQLGTIGMHRFYRFGGAAGAPAAFRFAYFGGEPLAAPHSRSTASASAEDPALDPLVLQRAYETGLKTAQGNAVLAASNVRMTAVRAAPAPAYAQDLQSRGGEALYKGEKLPEASGIRPEYQNSGRWIAQPVG
jgi:spore germination cell wall hydrolase CwlJ-like protein